MATAISAGEAYVSVSIDASSFKRELAAFQGKIGEYAKFVKQHEESFNIKVDVKNVSSAVSKLDSVENTAKDVAKAVSSAAPAALATFAAINAALGALGANFAKTGDTFDKMSLRTGMSTEALSEFAYAAEMCGSDISEVENALKQSQQKLLEAKNGSTEAQAAFQNLGLSVEELSGLSSEELFQKLANSIALISDPTEKAGAALKLFGDSGQRLLPLFSAGPEGLSALREEAKELGVSVSEEAASSGASLTDAFARVKNSLQGFSTSLFEQTAPAVTNLLNLVAKTIARFRQWISDNSSLVKSLMPVVSSIGTFTVAILGGIVAVSKLKAVIEALNAVRLFALANPWTAALAAIVAVIAAVKTYQALASKKPEYSTKAAESYENGETDRKQDQSDFDRLKTLESISKTHKLTNEQISEAVKLAASLKGKYGDIGIAVDETTGKITLATNAQRDLNKAMLEARKHELEAAIKEAETNNDRSVVEAEVAKNRDVSLADYWLGKKDENGNRGFGAFDFGWGGVFGKTKEEIKAEVLRGDASFDAEVNSVLAKSSAALERYKTELNQVNKSLEDVPETAPKTPEKTEEELAKEEERYQTALKETTEFERRMEDKDKSDLDRRLDKIHEETNAYKRQLHVLKSIAEAKGDLEKVNEITIKITAADEYDKKLSNEAKEDDRRQKEEEAVRAAEEQKKKDDAIDEAFERAFDTFASPMERLQKASYDLQDAIVTVQEAQESGDRQALANALDQLSESQSKYDSVADAVADVAGMQKSIGGTFNAFQSSTVLSVNTDKQLYNETKRQTGYLRTIAQNVGRNAVFS